MNSENFSKALGTIDDCVGQYINERRQVIDSFVEHHFSLQEAIEIQKKSVITDLLFYPLNALWSIPYLSLKKSIETLEKLGWMKFNGALEIIPSGFKTRYQKETERLIAEEFLAVGTTAKISRSAPTALMQSLQKKTALGNYLKPEDFSRLETRIASEFSKEIDKYTASQVLVSDLASSAMTLFTGRFFFGNGSLDIFGMGSRIARKMARDRAADNFFLGKGLGSVFYNIVPVEPSKTQIFLATLSLGLLLTCFSLFAAVMGDPLRKKLGLHNKKLSILLHNLEERLFLIIKDEIKRSCKGAESLKRVD